MRRNRTSSAHVEVELSLLAGMVELSRLFQPAPTPRRLARITGESTTYSRIERIYISLHPVALGKYGISVGMLATPMCGAASDHAAVVAAMVRGKVSPRFSSRVSRLRLHTSRHSRSSSMDYPLTVDTSARYVHSHGGRGPQR